MAHRHSVLTPDPLSKHEPAPSDVALLLADLVRARRIDDRAWLLEPFAPPAVCVACEQAYRIAHSILDQAGGVEAWLAAFETRDPYRWRAARYAEAARAEPSRPTV